MSSTSIGAGNAADHNENPAPDSRPSKTLGAESGPDEQASAAQGSEGDGTEADVLSPEGLLRDTPAKGVPVDPAYFPDGPNVEASPWELEAAQGKSSLPPKD